jgi:hypothetical protein
VVLTSSWRKEDARFPKHTPYKLWCSWVAEHTWHCVGHAFPRLWGHCSKRVNQLGYALRLDVIPAL